MGLLISTLTINACGIALRNFALGFGVDLLIAFLLIPITIAFLVRGGPFLEFIPLFVAPLWILIRNSSAQLHKIFRDQIVYRRKSEIIADQFDFAINNMSHGVCMVSPDEKVIIANAALAEFFGLPRERKIVGVAFDALLRLSVKRGAISAARRDLLLRDVRARAGAASERRLQIETTTGQSYEVTINRNANDTAVLVIQNITEKRNAERIIDDMARFDGVTRLHNRRSFEAALSLALGNRNAGDGGDVAVYFMDLDGFKHVNDTLGHKSGDRLLAIAAARLRGLARPEDFVARWGGDEFVLMRPNSHSNEDLGRFAATMIAELSQPCVVNGSEVVVGASIGIAIAEDESATAEFILQQADMALYTAKREGRGHYRIFEDAMNSSAQARRLLELDLHAAVAASGFELNFQPIVDLKSERVVSFEALARWNHTTRGYVSPAIFVPVLEDLNLMNTFGAWVLESACREAACWPEDVRISVNVSAKQLESETLFNVVQRALNSSGLAPNRLELEITETALLSGDEVAGETLERLHGIGVRIALDDFGTGYSSLSHLIRFPLDKVKIDQSFTRLLGREDRAAVLVENVARLSQQLGMCVNVEGVETREQLELVRKIGAIGECQGYWFGKPMSAEQARAKYFSQGRHRAA